MIKCLKSPRSSISGVNLSEIVKYDVGALVLVDSGSESIIFGVRRDLSDAMCPKDPFQGAVRP